jgi:hypothetical protein
LLVAGGIKDELLIFPLSVVVLRSTLTSEQKLLEDALILSNLSKTDQW